MFGLIGAPAPLFNVANLSPLLTIVNSSCYISEMNDVLGFIRVLLPRYTAKGQRDAMFLNCVARVVQMGEDKRATKVPSEMRIAPGDASDVIRLARPGTVVAVLHAHLLADPKRRNVRGAMRRDFRQTWEAIHAKGAVVWELYTDRRSDHANDREAMALDAVDSLALGRHKVRGSDKRGRPEKTFTEEQWAQAERVWESRRIKRWEDVKKKLPKGMSLTRAYRRFKARNIETT